MKFIHAIGCFYYQRVAQMHGFKLEGITVILSTHIQKKPIVTPSYILNKHVGQELLVKVALMILVAWSKSMFLI